MAEWRTCAKWLIGAIFALVVLALSATPAAAHAGVLSSNPSDGAVLETAPTGLIVEFGERVYPGGDTVLLTGDDGRDWPLQQVDVDGRAVRATVGSVLPPGGYRLHARPRSGSNHALDVTIHFAVEADPATQPAAGHKSAPHTGAGGGQRADHERPDHGDAGAPAVARGVELVGLAVAGGGSVGLWLVAAPVFVRRPRRLMPVVAGVGLIVAGRLAATPLGEFGEVSGRIQAATVLELVAAVAVGLLLTARRFRAASVAAAFVLAGAAAGGHGGFLPGLHLGAASVWLGTVVVALLSLPASASDERTSSMRRASGICGLSFAAAVLTGLAQYPFGEALAAGYRTILVAKFASIVLALAFAGMSLLALRRWRVSVRTVAFEAIALGAVVALAASLGTSARTELQRVVTLDVAGSGRIAQVAVAPGIVGHNRIVASNCRGFASVSGVRVQLRNTSLAVSTPALPITCGGDAVVTVVSLPGTWEAVLHIPGEPSGELAARFHVPESH